MRRTWTIAAVVSLLVILAAELLLSVRRESPTIDESGHLYAGYSYWKRGDFGVSPDHPPLVRLIAALPLLPLGLPVLPPPNTYFQPAANLGGVRFLYSNDAGNILFRARAAVSILALCLALLVFAAGNEMFGTGAGLFALALFAFEPNILGHGPLVTTDMGATCGVFAAVYSFYRYCKQPSVLRLLVCGLAAGLALAAKHSTVLIVPMFVLLAVTEIARRRGAETGTPETRGRQTLRLLGCLAAIAVTAVTVLWACYGFRYKARPSGLEMIPPAATFVQILDRSAGGTVIQFLERQRWLPEAYLYGLTSVAVGGQNGREAFLLGRLYPKGRWFYFPTAFVIKSTLGFLLLLALLVAARGIRLPALRREIFFIAAPPIVWFAVAMTSKLDIGIRHVLPVYPFLIVFAGAVAWMLIRQSRRWAYVAAVLLAFHTVSSLKAFPDYLPYSNEIWGGSSNTHKYLADSNVGWGGGLKALKDYVSTRHIAKCWFAYDGFGDPGYYQIPCSPLPTRLRQELGRRQEVVPEEIQGPVFISSLTATGFDWGPEDMNPYNQFADLPPSAVLQGEILVFDGTFHVPKVSGMSHFLAANRLFAAGQPDEALLEAQAAAQLDPQFLPVHEMIAYLCAQKQEWEEAYRAYQTAMHLYQTVHPEFVQLAPPPRNPLSP